MPPCPMLLLAVNCHVHILTPRTNIECLQLYHSTFSCTDNKDNVCVDMYSVTIGHCTFVCVRFVSRSLVCGYITQHKPLLYRQPAVLTWCMCA